MPEQYETILDEVIKEVSAYSEGIDAAVLGDKMALQGYQPYSVQKAIRFALDRGQIVLGPHFRLQRRTEKIHEVIMR